ncbi:phosphonate ABC transporter, permease protein PhnE [Thiohalocapsa marina]|uniref:phosphonate ABC transporter, permease protein PhnE n=1 Tax=Thiohalocapsa marina TaxID=424902 RepID=UPI001FE6DD9E|nr:phosphonate ABC transporter, permease protein PhnE [Thiohalocapsa marina]
MPSETAEPTLRDQAPRRHQSRDWPSHWRRPPLIADARLRWALIIAVACYLVLGIGSLEVNWARVADGWERGLRFLGGFLQPDFQSRWGDIEQGLMESLTMTLTATVVGVLISVPIGIGAARNLAPMPVYLLCRGIIAVSRSLQEIIVAILFVAMVGFGPLAGFLTLAFATIGFLSKLLAEDIEEIDAAQAEAVRATGASWLQVLNYAVQPQVMPRLIGLSLYRLDINFRESAVIGIVGAGGVGATLNTAIDRYEYDSAAAVLLLIIAIVMLTEYSSSWVRRQVQ